MKQLTLILSFLLSAFICFGQPVDSLPIKQNIGSPNTLVQVPANGGFRAGLINRSFADTTTANLSYLDAYAGATIFTLDNRFWIRNQERTAWVELTGGASTIITILTDSSFTLCSFVVNVASNCDTITVNNLLNPIQSVFVINDSTLLVCDIEANCDTVQIPQHNFSGIGARNGLTMATPTIVEFGGDLIHGTQLNARFNVMRFTGTATNDYPFYWDRPVDFTTGTAIASFRSLGGISGQPDYLNLGRLGINYTGAAFSGGLNGYLGDQSAYLIGVNATGQGTLGLRTDAAAAKLNMIAIHLWDTANTAAVDIIGKHPPNANYQATPGIGSLGLLPYRIATFHDNNNITFYGYPNTRNDAPTSRAFYSDASGNVKYGPISAGSTVNIFNDTTIIICSQGTNLCDTTVINNIGNLQTVTILNDSTIIVCGPSLCDTLVVPQADFNTGITANNGLTMNTPTNVQLGGALVKNTTITPGALYTLTIQGSFAAGTSLIVNNSGVGIEGTSTGAAAGINGNSSSGNGLYGVSETGVGVFGWTTNGNTAGNFLANAASTNTVIPVEIIDRTTSGAAAAGIGASIDIYIEQSTGAHNAISNQLISKWTTATAGSRVSEFSIAGVDNAVTATLFTLSGSGATRLNKYGIGTFTGTATRGLAVDASGNLIETTISSSGLVYTASNGLTMTANDVTLGGILTANTTIAAGSFNLALTGSNTGLTTAVFNVTNTSSSAATAIKATSNASSSIAVYGVSTSGTAIFGSGAYGFQGDGTAFGVYATSTNGTAVAGLSTNSYGGYFGAIPSSTNTVVDVLSVNRFTSGTPANGIGGRIVFQVATTSGGGSGVVANQLISKWTTATNASRVSEFSITGVNAAVTATLFTLAGSGAARLNIYGTGGFTGTSAFCLAVDASGNIIEVACAGPGGGSVNSVLGTAGRITSTGGTDPIINIDPNWTGQNTLVTLGTITTGVWTGTTIADDNGGTGQSTYTQLDILYASAANTLSKLAGGTALQILRINAGATALEWATPGTGGTVTTVSIGNLSPLFTASVATATTTPAITFALSNAAANTWFGNNTSGSTTPSFNAFGTGVNTWVTTPSSANLITAVTDETGTNVLVFNTSPTLITPILGTPTSVTLTNATGLPVSTGISGLATGIAAFLATPTSANFASAVTNETGTAGFVVLSISPTLTTPVLGIATATSINKVLFTTPATTATLTILNNKVFTVNKTMTLDGTDNQTYTFPTTSATIARTDAANTFTGVQTFNGNVTLNNTLFSGNSITTNSQSGTTYTILSTDNGDVIDFTSASAVTVTVPSGLPTGFNCTIRQLAAGQITLSASGTTLRNFSNETKTGGLWAVINLMWISANVYTISGETGP